MRICIVTTKYNFKTAGGSVSDIDLRAKGLLERGHTVTVVSAFSHFNLVEGTFPYVFREEFVREEGLIGIQRGVYRLLRKYESEADVFQVDGQVFAYGAGWYRLCGGRTPVVAFVNHWLSSWGDESVASARQTHPSLVLAVVLKAKLRLFVERLFGVPVANRIDAFIYNTPRLGETYQRFGFKNGTILPDFADTLGIVRREGITPERIFARQEADRVVTILCAGRMLPEKGFDLVIRAFAMLPHKEKYRVIMSGTGPELEKLKVMAEGLKLSAFFSFPGWVERETLLDFFRTAHIFIFPNWWPDYGAIVLIEALSFGLPSIIPRGGALEWLSGGTALTFERRNPSDLARVIAKLGEDRVLRIETAQRGLTRVADLDYRVLTQKLEEVFESVRM